MRVVLLHGLARTWRSMRGIAGKLGDEGFETANIGYPSRSHPVERLALDFVLPAIRERFPDDGVPINFVTHSMGGIIVRCLAASGKFRGIGRVVMLAPPNGGSEIVDTLGGTWVFRVVNGDAGRQLGTKGDSLPRRLGEVEFELGVIAGDRPLNPLLAAMIPGASDGKVSVANTKVAGMADFLLVSCSHSFIMNKREVVRQTVNFLRHGRFDEEYESTPRQLAKKQGGYPIS